MKKILFLSGVLLAALGPFALMRAAAPTLQIQLSTNLAVLRWPTSAVDYVLKGRTNVQSGSAWEPVNQPLTTVGQNFQVTVPVSGGEQYYQLSTVCTNLDRPDPLFVDANCDGIDGNPATAIFVAPPPFGSDSNSGTMLQPLANLAAAVQLAGGLSPTRDVYVARGTYVLTNSLALASKVGIFGLYDGTTNWTRAANNDTIIQGPSTAIVATNLTGESRLEGFHIVAADAVQPGESSYGIRVYRCTGPVVVHGNSITSGSAGAGQNGANGDVGFPGGGGYSGDSGDDGGGGRQGGSSLCGIVGGRGGNGGNGGYASAGTPGLGGDGWNGIPFSPGAPGFGGGIGAPCDKGGRGGVGHRGADGLNGTNAVSAGSYGTIQDGLFTPDVGQAGLIGTSGNGGGGAGGGGANAYSVFGCVLQYGGGGGAGGGGGCPGEAGQGGQGGGCSFGVSVSYGRIDLSDNLIFTGTAGDGGRGGNGGSGGTGGRGGAYGDDTLYGNAGEAGGDGGRGGSSGSGSGGSGGHSIGIFVDQFSTETIGFNQIFLGLPGLGGEGGTNSVLGTAPKGPTGIFRDTLMIPN